MDVILKGSAMTGLNSAIHITLLNPSDQKGRLIYN